MATNLTADLIRVIIETMQGVPDNWDSMSVIIASYEGTFNSASGYAYSADGTISPFACDPWKVIPVLDKYLAEKYKPDEKLPVMILLQFKRTDGSYTVTFEDTDETRWKVTPRNYKELREELRP